MFYKNVIIVSVLLADSIINYYFNVESKSRRENE